MRAVTLAAVMEVPKGMGTGRGFDELDKVLGTLVSLLLRAAEVEAADAKEHIEDAEEVRVIC